MPLFHGNAIMALWAPALAVGASVALAGRFSASRFLADVRHFGATRFTYVGKALAYVLATPARPDDADNTLRQGFGTEASAPDRAIFERRFGCRLVEGYGSSEGGAAINVTPDTPPGSLGRPRAHRRHGRGRSRHTCASATGPASTPAAGSCNAGGRHRRDRQPRSGARTSRATTRTPTATPSGSATAGTGPATWPTATRPASSTSPAEAATGCGSTRRTSPPPPSSGSSNATPTWPPSPSTPCPTPAPGTRSWPPSSCAPASPSTPTASPPSWTTQPDLGHQVVTPLRPALSGPPPHRHRQDHQGAAAGRRLAVRRARLLEPAGAASSRYRLLTDDDRRALRQEFDGPRPRPARSRPATALPLSTNPSRRALIVDGHQEKGQRHHERDEAALRDRPGQGEQGARQGREPRRHARPLLREAGGEPPEGPPGPGRRGHGQEAPRAPGHPAPGPGAKAPGPGQAGARPGPGGPGPRGADPPGHPGRPARRPRHPAPAGRGPAAAARDHRHPSPGPDRRLPDQEGDPEGDLHRLEGPGQHRRGRLGHLRVDDRRRA